VDETGHNCPQGGYRSVYGKCNSGISLFEAVTTVLEVLNVSGTMATQGGRVQLKQFDMCLALNMAKMAKEAFSCAPIQKRKYLILNPCSKAPEEKAWGVQCPGHKKVNTAIQRQLAMLVKTTHPEGFLSTRALQRFSRHTGDANTQEHLHPTDTVS
jgi:hypothetical protein